jgi:hypothetical protein
MMNWKDLEAIHRGLRNVRSRISRSGTEENYDEDPASIAGVSALIRIGYFPGTDVEHYLLGDQFRSINVYGIERIPVPMRHPKSEITPSKKCARAYSKSKYNFRRFAILLKVKLVCMYCRGVE